MEMMIASRGEEREKKLFPEEKWWTRVPQRFRSGSFIEKK
jgi:hypothetical protein